MRAVPIKWMPTTILQILFVYVSLIKIPAWLWLRANDFVTLLYGPGSGNDANYYDKYAVGVAESAAQLWPVILRALNSFGLYDRSIVAGVLFVLSALVVPMVSASLVAAGRKRVSKYLVRKLYWIIVVILSIYPSLFLFSLDIYRDVFMLVVFLAGVELARRVMSAGFMVKRLGLFFLFLVVVFLAYELRRYLGPPMLLALLVAPVIYHLINGGKRPKVWLLIAAGLYLLSLTYAYQKGLLAPLVNYRGEQGFSAGGTTFGIGFSNLSAYKFVYYLGVNFIFQILGLWAGSIKALPVFIMETTPFLIASLVLLRNIEHWDLFVCYLVVFAIFYSTVFLIGNDNLGTAIRLRIFAYIAVYIAAARAYLISKEEAARKGPRAPCSA